MFKQKDILDLKGTGTSRYVTDSSATVGRIDLIMSVGHFQNPHSRWGMIHKNVMTIQNPVHNRQATRFADHTNIWCVNALSMCWYKNIKINNGGWAQSCQAKKTETDTSLQIY